MYESAISPPTRALSSRSLIKTTPNSTIIEYFRTIQHSNLRVNIPNLYFLNIYSIIQS